jgi:hypothetical protein
MQNTDSRHFREHWSIKLLTGEIRLDILYRTVYQVIFTRKGIGIGIDGGYLSYEAVHLGKALGVVSGTLKSPVMLDVLGGLYNIALVIDEVIGHSGHSLVDYIELDNGTRAAIGDLKGIFGSRRDKEDIIGVGGILLFAHGIDRLALPFYYQRTVGERGSRLCFLFKLYAVHVKYF